MALAETVQQALSSRTVVVDYISMIKQLYTTVQVLVQQSQVPWQMFTKNCTSGTPAVAFEVKTLLGFAGRPGLVTESDIALLEKALWWLIMTC